MNRQIEDSKRRLVIITDPHIAANDKYPVYADANRDYFVKDCNNS